MKRWLANANLLSGSLAALMILAAAASPGRAEDAGPLPTCRPTVPMPPPEPPIRPDGLVAEPPPNPPIAEAPLPPQRPAELSLAPTPAQDAAPPEQPADGPLPKGEPPQGPPPSAPLPPTRPPELSSSPPLELKVGAPPPSDLPTCTPTLDAPLPPGRPVELSPQPAKPPEASLPLARPHERPLAPGATEKSPLPPARPPELSGDGALKLIAPPPEDGECLKSLDALGVAYAKAAPIVNGQCTVANPLTVSKLGNDIAIGAPEIMVCRLAEGLTRWTAQVQQIAEKELGETLKGLTLGGTYVCRGQNHGTEAQLSEHAFANAADVMGFTFVKRAPILVGPLAEGSKEAAFLAAVRTRACEYFTTVLGPGSDAQHANHLHLDERERKAGFRLCQ